ncbi:MAG: hypothetical protein ACREQ5_34525 [Candidatus Dormibacteria bacterium]
MARAALSANLSMSAHPAGSGGQARAGAALDAVVAQGALAEHDRAQIARDPAMWSVDAVLRRAELTGRGRRRA